tara:strand:- start:1415 stop:2098 length:684 start_codon:yes stop_codon:yes gene_type:complete
MQTHQLFPLSVAQDRIIISEEERSLLANTINDMRKSAPQDNQQSAWTGDTQGHEFIFSDPLFHNIADKISEKIKAYLDVLSIDVSLLDLYYQRSWATFSQNQQRIAFHSHAQSNISFAYYLVKPPNSGGIIFNGQQLQNEVANDIFNQDKHQCSLIKSYNAHNAKQVILDAEQDSIIIFPSKASHATAANQSGKTRISLSGDVTLMLKNSEGFEHLMPSFKQWQALR